MWWVKQEATENGMTALLLAEVKGQGHQAQPHF